MKKVDARFFIAVAATAMLSAVFPLGCSRSLVDVDGTAGGDATVNFRNSPVDVKILNTKSRFVNGLLEASLELESGYSRDYRIEYKFSWYDSDGMEIDEGSTAWMPLFLHGREVRTLKAIAPNPAARSFKIKLREADIQ